MGLLDIFRNKSKLKPSEVALKLSGELDKLCLPMEDGVAVIAISDRDCNELESFLAASCAGVSANAYVKRQPKPDEIEKCLTICSQSGLLIKIARTVAALPPETRRIMSAIWGYLLKIESPKSFQRPMVEYLISNTQGLDLLFEAYGKNTSGSDVIIGVMIRDACRYSKVVNYVVSKGLVFNLFPVLVSGNFDVSADAFQTLKEILTNHKDVSAPWLNRNFKEFFELYMKPLRAPTESDYVIVRQSLSILSSLLLDRQFMDTMIQFVGNDEFLRLVMILLGNESKVVRYEAFHIFKIFAANPNKTSRICRILIQNRERIIKILDKIENDRLDDNEFRQDKAAVVGKLTSMG
jgi:calcium binding protein 39